MWKETGKCGPYSKTKAGNRNDLWGGLNIGLSDNDFKEVIEICLKTEGNHVWRIREKYNDNVPANVEIILKRTKWKF